MPERPDMDARETFSSRFGVVMTMIGVAVGLGNVWRFPYMVGAFGGAPFVLFYVFVVVVVGIPALTAEWTLGMVTRRGPVGAFGGAGLPMGRLVGWFFFCVVTAATAYYTNALGWVLYHAVGELVQATGRPFDAAAILPPDAGFDGRSFGLQVAATAALIGACAWVLLRGVRRGIERASKVIVPGLLVILLILIGRSLTLPGAGDGVAWYLGQFDPDALTPSVMMAALGQAIFTLSLGGTFMVVYGSYLTPGSPLLRNAVVTAGGDLAAGLLAGLAIFPAVFALGAEPGSGPGLLFATLPAVFSAMPGGWFFGLLFFLGLLGAAFLSDVAAFEVLVAGLADTLGWPRRRAIGTMALVVFAAALPPMINMKVFVPWDLTFGSGMQTLGALLSVLTVGWVLDRARMLDALSGSGSPWRRTLLVAWLRFVVPGVILAVGIWWFYENVLT